MARCPRSSSEQGAVWWPGAGTGGSLPGRPRLKSASRDRSGVHPHTGRGSRTSLRRSKVLVQPQRPRARSPHGSLTWRGCGAPQRPPGTQWPPQCQCGWGAAVGERQMPDTQQGRECRCDWLSGVTAELRLVIVQFRYKLVTTDHALFILMFYLIIFIFSDSQSSHTSLIFNMRKLRLKGT